MYEKLTNIADKTYDILLLIEKNIIPNLIALTAAFATFEAVAGHPLFVAIPTVLFSVQRFLNSLNKIIADEWKKKNAE